LELEETNVKPWECQDWLNKTYAERWDAIKAYLKAGQKTYHNYLTADEIRPYDAEIAEVLDSEGGSVMICRHNVEYYPDLPCDECWNEQNVVEETRDDIEPDVLTVDSLADNTAYIDNIHGEEKAGYRVQVLLDGGKVCWARDCYFDDDRKVFVILA
jgi:hypothetical protein